MSPARSRPRNKPDVPADGRPSADITAEIERLGADIDALRDRRRELHAAYATARAREIRESPASIGVLAVTGTGAIDDEALLAEVKRRGLALGKEA
jgi:hypothetical protein